ncbi:MAG: hypothetical protein O2800_03730 [Planctomycetota bacterium]|nr:hypothetical protein [Planctomycetota bacterium]
MTRANEITNSALERARNAAESNLVAIDASIQFESEVLPTQLAVHTNVNAYALLQHVSDLRKERVRVAAEVAGMEGVSIISQSATSASFSLQLALVGAAAAGLFAAAATAWLLHFVRSVRSAIRATH